MKNGLNLLILIGKLAYFFGTLLFFNFFFGWIFLGFFYWLLLGGILFILLMSSLYLGKKILFKPFHSRDDPHNNTYKTRKGKADVIDVEAEIFSDEQLEGDDQDVSS